MRRLEGVRLGIELIFVNNCLSGKCCVFLRRNFKPQKIIVMVSSNEVINLIKNFSLTERLIIVEETLRNIREENSAKKVIKNAEEVKPKPAILSLAGIFDKNEARIFSGAVKESRKIDKDEW